MKILLTADLHINIPRRHPRTGQTTFEAFAQAVRDHQPNAVVVAGDIGSIYHAGNQLRMIREAAGDIPVAMTLGNHDHWVEPDGHVEFPSLQDAVDGFWKFPADIYKITLLDAENLNLGPITLVGGYGHFDLGHAEPNFTFEGKAVTEEVYLSGQLGRLFWNDFHYIPNCARFIKAEAQAQAAGIASRLAASDSQRLVVVTHTCPWRELNGHPLRGNEQDLLSAYSGNSLVGKALEQEKERIELLFCGHTHMPVRERGVCSIRSLNIGTDYGIFRGIIYDTVSGTIEWIGEPFKSS